jgi:CRP-like cAMP-binding protein
MRSYLKLEKGIFDEAIFLLDGRLTLGRRPSSDVYLSDPSVSREHAVVYLTDKKAVVEDLGSLNGTFVNGSRIKKTIINDGDILRVGHTVFRFVQEEVKPGDGQLTETQDVPQSQSETDWRSDGVEPPSRSQRLTDVISRVPLFSNLEEEELALISKAAHLVVHDRGRTIVQEGDRGKSLFIILDGKVRVATCDQQGREIVLANLSDDEFFGEISFLTGAPHTATVQALTETLLCEISFQTLREVMYSRPTVKEQLEQVCRARYENRENKKREAGIMERRGHPRMNARLPVSFSISPTSRAVGEFQGKVFRSLSQNISVSGIRIQVQDQTLFSLPLGCQLRLEISLPNPWGTIRCLAILRHVVEGREGHTVGHLGAEFLDLPHAQTSRLAGFLYGDLS